MSTRVKLLQAFQGNPGDILSGEVLARQLGVSRTAIWKQIQSIQDEGVPIESAGRQGYRLNAPFDSSLAKLKPFKSWTPHYYLNTPSTQLLAKAGAAAGLPEGHVWIAETQSKGRGRLDRKWDSTYGGLWFSVLLRPTLPPSNIPPLTLLAGLSLQQAVHHLTGLDLKVKWPNDLLIKHRSGWAKCAGILTEMSGQMSRTDWVVIGVGLNVNNVISKELSDRAASLFQLTGKLGNRAKFLEQFLSTFQKAYRRYHKEGFQEFRKAYWESYFAPGQMVALTTVDGPLRGKARGVDASGAIMVEFGRKIHTISEGEIILS